MDAIDEIAIDFHVIRAQFGPQAQAGIACAQIIQGDAEAHRAVVMKRLVQQFKVIGRRLLGQFDDHLIGRNSEGAEQLKRSSRFVCCVKQRFRGSIEKEFAAQGYLAIATTCSFPAAHLKFIEAACVAGRGEQVDWGMQWAVGWAAAESLVTENATLRE